MKTDSALPMMSPHPPPSNEASNSAIPSTPSSSDPQHVQQQHQQQQGTTPLGSAASHTPGGPKSNAAYSPYVALPSVDTPGWPHSAGPPPHPLPVQQQQQQRLVPQPPSSSSSSSSTANNTVDLYGMTKPLLPSKEYEQELREQLSGPDLLYDYSSMTAW